MKAPPLCRSSKAKSFNQTSSLRAYDRRSFGIAIRVKVILKQGPRRLYSSARWQKYTITTSLVINKTYDDISDALPKCL